MNFTFRPAKREGIGLIIVIAGGTGSGKTVSAMELAVGLTGGDPFLVIDTEASRAKHYAHPTNDGLGKYRFDHCDFSAPFRPTRYAEAIEAGAAENKYQAIIVDSGSHMWAGEGGMLDMQEKELTRLTKGRTEKIDSYKMLSWVAPKVDHRKFIYRTLQVRSKLFIPHLIICLRAEDKVEMVKVGGKMKVQPKTGPAGFKGWVPICDKSLPFEATMSFLLMAEEPGVPKPIKLEGHHKSMIPLDRPLTRDAGKMLSEWASGGKAPTSSPKSTTKPEGPITKEQSSELGALVKNLGIDPGAGQNILHAMFPGKHWPVDSSRNQEIKARNLTEPEATKLIKSLREVEDGLATIGEGGAIEPVVIPKEQNAEI